MLFCFIPMDNHTVYEVFVDSWLLSTSPSSISPWCHGHSRPLTLPPPIAWVLLDSSPHAVEKNHLDHGRITDHLGHVHSHTVSAYKHQPTVNNHSPPEQFLQSLW